MDFVFILKPRTLQQARVHGLPLSCVLDRVRDLVDGVAQSNGLIDECEMTCQRAVPVLFFDKMTQNWVVICVLNKVVSTK